MLCYRENTCTSKSLRETKLKLGEGGHFYFWKRAVWPIYFFQACRSALKKLSVLVRNRYLKVGDIFCSVIKRPRNTSLLVSTSNSIEFKFEILKRNKLSVHLGTWKIFLRNHCWQRSSLFN